MSFITKIYKNFFQKNKFSETVIDIRPKNKINNGNIILLVHPDGKEEQIHAYKNLDVRFIGKNSLLKIHSSVKIRSKLTCTLGEGGVVILNENVTIGNVKFSMFGENSTIHIGKNTTIHNATFYCDNEPNSKIYVGEECLFSIEIVIRACDGHTIYEKGNPSHILNKPKSGVFIGNHVWIGQRAFI